MTATRPIPEIPEPPVLPGWDKPFQIGNVPLASRFTMAPLAGYTNLPFRLTVREVGGIGLCTTDLINYEPAMAGFALSKPGDPAYDRGSCGLGDRTHVVNLTSVYQLPSRAKGALGVLANITWDRALGYALERPKSVTTDMLEKWAAEGGRKLG